MISVLKSGPMTEPVTELELREQLKLGTQEDGLLNSLITSARLMVEAQSGVRLIAQSWDVLLDEWPGRIVKLPHWPIINTTEIALLGDRLETVPATRYRLDTTTRPARIILRDKETWPQPKLPELGIVIRVTAGYGTDKANVPTPLKQAILALAAHWYETDSWGGQRLAQTMPGQVAAIVQSYRQVRI